MTHQFDPEQVVRIRMRVAGIDEEEHTVWSDRMRRLVAEVDVAGGPVHLAIEHAFGRRVISAVIVPWRFD